MLAFIRYLCLRRKVRKEAEAIVWLEDFKHTFGSPWEPPEDIGYPEV